MKTSSEQKKGAFRMTTGLRYVKAGLLVAVCAGLVGCKGGTDDSPDLKELQKGQKAILERLDKLEKVQKQLLASRSPRRPTVDYDKVYDLPIGKSPVRGAKDAKVTLVEFSDFQCPYSHRAQPLIESLLKAYPEDLRHVYKNFPLRFHKQAMPAAKACLAAGMQGKFWEMEAHVFKNPKNLEEKDLKKYAGEIGLDVKKFEKDFKSAEVEKRVQEDIAEGRKASVTGTPTLFLNGKRVRNRSEEAMKKEIDEILKGKKNS